MEILTEPVINHYCSLLWRCKVLRDANEKWLISVHSSPIYRGLLVAAASGWAHLVITVLMWQRHASNYSRSNTSNQQSVIFLFFSPGTPCEVSLAAMGDADCGRGGFKWWGFLPLKLEDVQTDVTGSETNLLTSIQVFMSIRIAFI